MGILNPAEVFDKSAKIYQDKFMDVSMYADALTCFCDNISMENAGILDIACGPGNLIKYLLDKRSEYEILGVDLAPRMLDLAQANNPKATFRLLDCRDIGSIGRKFEGITCGFCLPYLTKEEATQLVVNTAALLKSGGVFYLSTMVEDEQNKSRYQSSSTGDEVYVHYHQEDYLLAAFLENGFEIIYSKRFSSPDNVQVKTTDLVLVGRLK